MRNRPGLSLAELLVVMLLGSLVGWIITTTVVRQQRFYSGAAEIHYVREDVRDAMEVLSTDIRGLSADDTVRLLADSAIELLANIGSSVACQIAGGEVGLPDAHPLGNSLSAFLVTPDSGDLALFLRTSDSGKVEWEQHRIESFVSRALTSSCAATSGFAGHPGLDSRAFGFALTLSAPPTGGVRPGTAVRFIRRGRYSLYRASDGEWYLGYRRCNAVGASICSALQPVSGPYRGYNKNPPASGLVFEYFDAAGSRLAPAASPLALRRVDITARSDGRVQEWLGDRPRGIADSATVAVAIRNGSR